MKRKAKVWEDLVLFLIGLSLLQIVLEEFAWVFFWPPRLRNGLVLSAFWFDLAFSVEFLLRSIQAIRRGAFRRYFTREMGWLDFLCSVPLLAGVSGPTFFFAAAGSLEGMAVRGGLGLLKVLKTVRIIRVLKITRAGRVGGSFFRRSPVCAQRQIAMVLSTALLPIAIVSLIGAAVLPLVHPESAPVYKARRLVEAFSDLPQLDSSFEGGTWIESMEPDILRIEWKGKVLFSREDPRAHHAEFDIISAESADGKLSLSLSLLGENRKKALSTLLLYASILAVLLSILLIYSPYHVRRISAPLAALVEAQESGAAYPNLSVPEGAEDEELFILARSLAEKGGKS